MSRRSGPTHLSGRRGRAAAVGVGLSVLAACGSPSTASVAAAQTRPAATVNSRPDAAAVACTGLDKALPGPTTPVQDSHRALPRVELPCLGPGASLRLSDLRGPALLNVWASWCGPCAAEVPFLVAAQRELRSQVRFVGIDLADEAADARAWNAFHEVSWPSLRDPAGAIRGPLRVPGPPVTFFVRSDGSVAGVHYGAFTSVDEVREAVVSNLGVGAPSTKGSG